MYNPFQIEALLAQKHTNKNLKNHTKSDLTFRLIPSARNCLKWDTFHEFQKNLSIFMYSTIVKLATQDFSFLLDLS